VSRLAADSASILRTLEEGSGFLRLRIDINEPHRLLLGIVGAPAVMEVVVVGPMKSRPEPLRRREPDAKAFPTWVGVVVLAGGTTTFVAFEG
jgi:hypothetical protein